MKKTKISSHWRLWVVCLPSHPCLSQEYSHLHHNNISYLLREYNRSPVDTNRRFIYPKIIRVGDSDFTLLLPNPLMLNGYFMIESNKICGSNNSSLQQSGNCTQSDSLAQVHLSLLLYWAVRLSSSNSKFSESFVSESFVSNCVLSYSLFDLAF